jgi:hypothetical protein
VRIDGFTCSSDGAAVQPLAGGRVADDIFARDISTEDTLSMDPLLKDPLEDEFVEVLRSSIPTAGEGLFLKRDAKVIYF